MSSDIAIKVENLSKCYQIYDSPRDRLKQFVMPRIQKTVGMHPKQYYREFWALKDVSFEVRKGETVGIIGRNGSGKSTLLQMICGTLNPTTGSITTHGRIAALLELGSGFNPEFTGRENIYLNAAITGLSIDEINDKIDSITEFSGLGDFINQPLKTYSSGMQARLAFSSAIHVDPSILIVDEALSVGDAGFQLKCMLRMRDMQEKGVTILFVSHDTSSVVRLCDHAFVMEHGRCVSQDRDPLKCVKLYEQLTRKVAMPEIYHRMPSKFDAVNYNDELQGIKETRIGSHEARYLSIDFMGDDNKIRQIFKSGEEIQIKALIGSNRDFDKVVTGFTLKNRTGVDVWGDNSLYANVDLCLKPGLSELVYRFKLHVPAGEYFLYVGLADISTERTELDQRWPVRRLTVISERQCLGFAFSPASIDLIEVSK
jgi:ABC-type polysaccharide/polyol phosphate transport system ATPase subunit